MPWQILQGRIKEPPQILGGDMIVDVEKKYGVPPGGETPDTPDGPDDSTRHHCEAGNSLFIGEVQQSLTGTSNPPQPHAFAICHSQEGSL